MRTAADGQVPVAATRKNNFTRNPVDDRMQKCGRQLGQIPPYDPTIRNISSGIKQENHNLFLQKQCQSGQAKIARKNRKQQPFKCTQLQASQILTIATNIKHDKPILGTHICSFAPYFSSQK